MSRSEWPSQRRRGADVGYRKPLRQDVKRILRELAEQRSGALRQHGIWSTGDFGEQFAGAFTVTNVVAGNRQIELGLQGGEVRALVGNAGALQARHRHR